MTLEEYIRAEIDAFCSYMAAWLEQGSDPRDPEIAKLVGKLKDPALADKVRDTTDRKTVRKRLQRLRFSLSDGDMVGAYTEWRTFDDDRRFVEQLLNVGDLWRGRKTVSSAVLGGTARWSRNGHKWKGAQWQREIVQTPKGSYARLVDRIAKRERCHPRTVRRYTHDPAK